MRRSPNFWETKIEAVHSAQCTVHKVGVLGFLRQARLRRQTSDNQTSDFSWLFCQTQDSLEHGAKAVSHYDDFFGDR